MFVRRFVYHSSFVKCPMSLIIKGQLTSPFCKCPFDKICGTVSNSIGLPKTGEGLQQKFSLSAQHCLLCNHAMS